MGLFLFLTYKIILIVIPAKAGIQIRFSLDSGSPPPISGYGRNDKKEYFSIQNNTKTLCGGKNGKNKGKMV